MKFTKTAGRESSPGDGERTADLPDHGTSDAIADLFRGGATVMDTLPIALVTLLAVPGIVAGGMVAFMVYALTAGEVWRAAQRAAVMLYARAFVALAGQWVPE